MDVRYTERPRWSRTVVERPLNCAADGVVAECTYLTRVWRDAVQHVRVAPDGPPAINCNIVLVLWRSTNVSN